VRPGLKSRGEDDRRRLPGLSKARDLPPARRGPVVPDVSFRLRLKKLPPWPSGTVYMMAKAATAMDEAVATL
jgi:hypothetical protein